MHAGWTGNNVVASSQGLLQGVVDEGAISWKGVRYAAPPTGKLRWREPQPVPAWNDVRVADEPGEAAPQLIPITDMFSGDEDCLKLNVWRPDDESLDLPIYVWVHGGANTAGNAAPNGDYSGLNLSLRSRMIVISINYRLGPFGWLMDPDLVPEGTGGNLGLLDIVAALRWIKANAEAFGGDPDNVTLTGESAGAANILALLCMDEAVGLFQRAILQSPLDMTSPVGLAQEESRKLLCSVLVRAKRARTMKEAARVLAAMSPAEKQHFFKSRKASDFLAGFSGGTMGMYDWPSLILDGEVLPLDGLKAFALGGHKVKVPLIIGSNRDEVGVFLFLEGKIRVRNPLYPKALAYGSTAWRANWIEAVAADLVSDPAQGPVYMYRFDWGSADPNGSSELPVVFSTSVGAFHALEIPFFLGNDTVAGYVVSKLIFNPWNDESREALTSAIMTYTRNFALGADLGLPAEDGELPGWPRFRALPPNDDSPVGLVFSATGELASIEPLRASESARQALLMLEASIPTNELYDIKSKLPPFMKNAWQ